MDFAKQFSQIGEKARIHTSEAPTRSGKQLNLGKFDSPNKAHMNNSLTKPADGLDLFAT
jgi:hypothetical protein